MGHIDLMQNTLLYLGQIHPFPLGLNRIRSQGSDCSLSSNTERKLEKLEILFFSTDPTDPSPVVSPFSFLWDGEVVGESLCADNFKFCPGEMDEMC